MPSIPSLFFGSHSWCLWLFVLVPMLINKRDTVRRTSDVALATRVLNSGAKSRLIKRRGPAASHRHDRTGSVTKSSPVSSSRTTRTRLTSSPSNAMSSRSTTTPCGRPGWESGSGRSSSPPRCPSRRCLSRTTSTSTSWTENSGALPVGGGVQASLFDPRGRTWASRSRRTSRESRPTPQQEPTSAGARTTSSVGTQAGAGSRSVGRAASGAGRGTCSRAGPSTMIRIHRRHLGPGGRRAPSRWRTVRRAGSGGWRRRPQPR